jgi:hypothetical protein
MLGGPMRVRAPVILCAARLVGLWAALFLAGCAFFPPLPVPDLEHLEPRGSWEIHRISSGRIREPSGLVRSRTYPGIFWTHGDSGDAPRIFAIDAGGELIAEFEVEGARHRDWEDIATDDSGHLYVGDFGNNTNRRRDLVVYRIPEPDPSSGGGRAHADLALAFRYADQERYPDLRRVNFDAEALFWMDGALHIFTKHRSDGRSTLYRLTATPDTTETALEPVARLELSTGCPSLLGNVTAADLHEDGRHLALLTYRALFILVRSPEGEQPFRVVRRIALRSRRTRQVESVAWDGDELIIGNEERYLFRIPGPLEIERYPP